jgi:hypothetical protein
MRPANTCTHKPTAAAPPAPAHSRTSPENASSSAQHLAGLPESRSIRGPRPRPSTPAWEDPAAATEPRASSSGPSQHGIRAWKGQSPPGAAKSGQNRPFALRCGFRTLGPLLFALCAYTGQNRPFPATHTDASYPGRLALCALPPHGKTGHNLALAASGRTPRPGRRLRIPRANPATGAAKIGDSHFDIRHSHFRRSVSIRSIRVHPCQNQSPPATNRKSEIPKS